MEELNAVLQEGLPSGTLKEFEDSKRCALLIRQSFLDLHDNFRHIVDPPTWSSNGKGEGAGVGFFKGADSMAMPEGSSLFDLVQTGATHTHAAIGVVVRLRKELSSAKDVPVLLTIDQYNSWFTFSEYEEAVTPCSCRPIHAREIATVFRPFYPTIDPYLGTFWLTMGVPQIPCPWSKRRADNFESSRLRGLTETVVIL